MSLFKKKTELDETVENAKETVETVVEEGRKASGIGRFAETIR